MADLTALTANEILGIPQTQPRRLFTWNKDAARSEYRLLSKLWHPDRSTGNADVFSHLSTLYAAAEKRLNRSPENVEIAGPSGKSLFLHFLAVHPFELGEMYIGSSTVAFAVRTEFADLFENAQRAIKGFQFASDTMKAQMSRFLPEPVKVFEGSDRLVLVVKRAPGMILLADAAEHVGGMDPRHVGWIGSSLHNLACYLDWAGMTHNAIGPDTYFIDPADHNGALLGGWFYARDKGSRLLALPDRAVAATPRDILSSKTADPRVDLELIRSTCRGLLDTNAPAPMTAWLSLASSGDAVADYAAWKKVLNQSFGDPKFVTLDLDPTELY